MADRITDERLSELYETFADRSQEESSGLREIIDVARALRELQERRGQCPADDAQREADAEFDKAMQAGDVPRAALDVYDSNSYRRVGLKQQYRVVMAPCVQSDGCPDIHGEAVLRAMVAAFNAMLLMRQR